MTRAMRLLIFVSCGWLICTYAGAQTLKFVGVDGRTSSITAAQFASLPHVSASVSEHDKPAQFDGVPLAAVLSLAGVQLGDALRGSRMTEVLLVSASDGYKVTFALAEIDPAFAVREIILADKRDGKPLDSREGPFRIVAPGDKRPARWIRQVAELKVVSAK